MKSKPEVPLELALKSEAESLIGWRGVSVVFICCYNVVENERVFDVCWRENQISNMSATESTIGPAVLAIVKCC